MSVRNFCENEHTQTGVDITNRVGRNLFLMGTKKDDEEEDDSSSDSSESEEEDSGSSENEDSSSDDDSDVEDPRQDSTVYNTPEYALPDGVSFSNWVSDLLEVLLFSEKNMKLARIFVNGFRINRT